jgi:hypothetical protein
MLEIVAAGAVDELIETLSMVAVTMLLLLLSLLLTAKPTYALVAMLMVSVEPTCVQIVPFGEIYALKVLPLLTIFIQYGAAIAPEFV